ncbi:hypothetical protein U1Q18_017462, partial [Sarracenia purpurea var. burkii]
MDGAPLTAQGEQSYGSEHRLVILDRDGGITAVVTGQASNECRGVPSSVSEWGGITGEDGTGVKTWGFFVICVGILPVGPKLVPFRVRPHNQKSGFPWHRGGRSAVT